MQISASESVSQELDLKHLPSSHLEVSVFGPAGHRVIWPRAPPLDADSSHGFGSITGLCSLFRLSCLNNKEAKILALKPKRDSKV